MIVGSARERRLWNVVTYAIAGFFGLTALGPIVWLVLTSLKTEADIVTAQGVVYWPSTLTLANYRELWDQTDFPTLFRNSLCSHHTHGRHLSRRGHPVQPTPCPGRPSADASRC